MKTYDTLYQDAVQLLKELINTQSFSKEESDTAAILEKFFNHRNILFQRSGNNLWAFANPFNPEIPTIWLNSHHDTVKPNAGYTLDPFTELEKEGKLFGLGSNDAGGPLVSLLATFTHFYNREDLPFNLIIIASAEEEISGRNGIASVISEIPKCDLAIVGEPTLMDLAVAEKGLMVIDAKVTGKAGHAAREEGVNALYLALDDLQKIKDFQFQRVSPFLGKTKVSATVIQSGKQHNVVPDLCEFTLDVRVTDAYSLEEALQELKSNLKAELIPRSLRLQSSHVPNEHFILKIAEKLGLKTYGSPTLSDQALIPYPSVKIGPGDSARSHTADEFIYLNEIQEGISGYISILETYIQLLTQES
ncbi:M20 family metallo-hydrolase [Algoriphagus machipongonensis]|uniref:Acetylornithine deacetylase n=1 Tax=Algoriphagus machipongonensis TaxID=388413 RepID=A3HST8_9BACT|nr:M20 family metallo-hydrolase [Algoriphagus machipongonensis]EAZ82906.1 acetylornithine deacetylase [Algoriphagus machipongonensis]